MRNLVNISLGGGGALYLNENLAEPIFSDGSGWFEVGYLAEEGLHITQDAEIGSVRGEENSLIKVVSPFIAISIEAILLQSAKEEIDFLNTTARNKYYQAYYQIEGSRDITQVWLFKKCQIIKKGGVQFNPQLRKIQIQINVVKE